jgi:hypothetical protein
MSALQQRADSKIEAKSLAVYKTVIFLGAFVLGQ